jgi:hypothetical protein
LVGASDIHWVICVLAGTSWLQGQFSIIEGEATTLMVAQKLARAAIYY